MTQKLNTDNGLQGRWTKTTGYNTGLAKVAVQYSADTPDSYRDVVNQTLVLRINPPRRMVKIATFAKPQNVMPHSSKKNKNHIYKKL
jgi:hypothetical protein